MNDIEALASTINNHLRDIRRGTLQFFGDWFGRPHDNIHTVVRAESNVACLRIHFDEGETLDIWGPAGLEIGAERFAISDAERVRWEWFCYGLERTAKNRFFLEYSRGRTHVIGTTNVDWYTPAFDTRRECPAVQIT